MAIDLVVVNYHTLDDLNAFLTSLDRFPPSVEATLTIVDVDTDEPARDLEWAGGVARWLTTRTNVGYATACNLAARHGRANIIGLFNADIELTAHAIDFCHAALEAHDDWGVLGPGQVDHRNRVRHAGIFGSNASPVLRGWNEINRGQYVDVREAVSVSGSAYFVKRSVWNELTACPLYQHVAPGALGAFLPTPHYYEETFCSMHAREHGHAVVYYGPVTIIHKWHRASVVGGWAEQQMPISRRYFREACDHHGIAHD